MGRTTHAAAVLLALTLITAGCAAEAPPATAKTTSTAVAAISAADIVTLDDATAWADSLDDKVTADEIGGGVRAISDMVPDLELGMAGNKIGQALVKLNAAILADPDTAGTKVDDLQAIIADIEAAAP